MALGRPNNTGNLKASDNPQLTNDGRTAAIGMYTFTYVPVGDYNVTGEKEGHVYYRIISVLPGAGTVTANVAIPDYAYINPATPTPTPVPTATPTPTPAATQEAPVADRRVHGADRDRCDRAGHARH